MKLSLAGGFHGRTGRAAQFSDSTRKSYRTHLATFRDRDDLITVKPNDVEGLRPAFADADNQGVFFEAMFMEPVMGEGDPGMAVTPEFFASGQGAHRGPWFRPPHGLHPGRAQSHR